MEMREENASYLSLHCPSDCLHVKKKKYRPVHRAVAIPSPFRITVSYCPEIANHCFLSYVLKNKKRLSTFKTPETVGC